MLFVYKLTKFFVKLFVKVVLLPVKLVAKLVGSDAAAGMAGGFADSLTDDGGSGDRAGGGTTTQETRPSAASATGRPQQEGALGTLSWVGSFLAERPELFVPALALGVVQAVLVGPTATAAGASGPGSTVASLVTMIGGVFVGGMFAHAVADSFRDRHRDLSGLVSAAASGLLAASGVGLAIVFGGAIVGGVLGGIGAVVIGPAAVLLVLPVLYLVLRVALAVPAAFVGGRGVTDALNESWTLSGGNVLTLTGLLVVAWLAAALSVIPVVGTVVATTVGTPLWMASTAHLYLATGGGPAGATVQTGSASGRGRREPDRSPSTGGGPAAGNQPEADASGRERASRATDDSPVDVPTDAGGTTAAESTADGSAGGVAASDADAGSSGVDSDPATAATGAALAETDTGTGDEPPGADVSPATDSDAVEASDTPEEPAAGESEAVARDDESTEVTDDAAEATGAENGETERGEPPATLPDDDAERVALVAAALESGDASPEHLDALVDALDADDSAVRRDAVEALGDLAVAEPVVADEVVAALRDCQLDPAVEVSEAASAALDRARETT